MLGSMGNALALKPRKIQRAGAGVKQSPEFVQSGPVKFELAYLTLPCTYWHRPDRVAAPGANIFKKFGGLRSCLRISSTHHQNPAYRRASFRRCFRRQFAIRARVTPPGGVPLLEYAATSRMQRGRIDRGAFEFAELFCHGSE